MKEYPSILGLYDISEKIGSHMIAQVKCDGSNIRAEWNKKKGFHKFGSRTKLIDQTDQQLGWSIPLFMNTLADPLDKIFKEIRQYKEAGEATVFFEAFTENSFAGTHSIKIENGTYVPNKPQLKLFDINIYKFGFVDPKQFYKDFIAIEEYLVEKVYEGVLTRDFIEDVRNSKYPGFEGVICKGGYKHSWWARKIKTLAYLDKLKNTKPKEYEAEIKEQIANEN